MNKNEMSIIHNYYHRYMQYNFTLRMEDYVFSTFMSELITNHQKNTLTSKKTLKSKYKIKNINEILERADLQLRKFGIILIGLEDNKRCNYKEADRIHLIIHEKMKNSISYIDDEFFKYLVIVLSIIFLKQNHISLEGLISLVKDHIDTKVLNLMKTKHYIAYKEENDVCYIVFSWRYYAEFYDFNPCKIINTLKMNKNTENTNFKDSDS